MTDREYSCDQSTVVIRVQQRVCDREYSCEWPIEYSCEVRLTDSDIMAAFRIFSPKAFTLALTHDKADDNSDVEGEADEDFGQDYGQAEIKILCDRFGYDQDVDSLIKEWDERTDFGLNHADCH